jgi:hypothetical protein
MSVGESTIILSGSSWWYAAGERYRDSLSDRSDMDGLVDDVDDVDEVRDRGSNADFEKERERITPMTVEVLDCARADTECSGVVIGLLGCM